MPFSLQNGLTCQKLGNFARNLKILFSFRYFPSLMNNKQDSLQNIGKLFHEMFLVQNTLIERKASEFTICENERFDGQL